MTSVTETPRRVTAPVRRLVNAPLALVVAIVVVWVGCSMAYAVLEERGPVESLWWGIVTGSTVGYGDSYPSSTAGRGVASVLIVTMLLLVPIAIGHVIAGLVVDRDQFSHDEQVALAETVESLHDRVETLEHLLRASLTDVHGSAWVEEHLREAASRESAHHDVDDRMLATFHGTPATPAATTSAPATSRTKDRP